MRRDAGATPLRRRKSPFALSDTVARLARAGDRAAGQRDPSGRALSSGLVIGQPPECGARCARAHPHAP